ncbi:MAG TPA: hypothetical protein DIU35_13190 [Candidatus Latescibacteria bacterium]|nr:hypothetical protein [Gemmatimonadota bacterium]HCR18429.1 hypothetical protein [Candidatus Latescibacterota bacterium]
MWAAIDRAAGLVNPGGLLLISIYNNVERHFGGSVMWSKIKCAYTRGPWILGRAMEVLYVLHFITRHVLTCRNPIRAIRGYDSGGRGMDFWHDMRDWLGGFPYEYATAGEVFRYVRENFGYELEHLDTHDGHGCNEFVFRRPGDQES